MTNETIETATTFAQTHSGIQHWVVRDPIPFGALSLILVPICIGVFVNCWSKVLQKKRITWESAFLKLATLTIATAMVVQISTSLYYSFYDTAMSGKEGVSGAALLAMNRLSLAHACSMFELGFLAVAFCFALVIITNGMKEKNNDLPTSGHPTALTAPLVRRNVRR